MVSRPPKPVAVPRGRHPPQEPRAREEAEVGGAAPGMSKPRQRLGSQQDQEESEAQGLPAGWRGAWDASRTLLPTLGPHPKHKMSHSLDEHPACEPHSYARPALTVISGPLDPGRRTAPLKPKRTRRAQSCDKLEPDRRQPPDPTGASAVGERAVPLPTHLSNMVHPIPGGWLSLPRKQGSLDLSPAGTSEPGTD